MPQDVKKNKLTRLGMISHQLEEELRKTTEKNREELENIKRKIQSLRKENQSLEQHLANLKLELNTELRPKEFMQFALYKAEERAPLFYDMANKEVTELTTIGESTERVYNEKISEFNKIIKETQQTLETLLKEVVNGSENLAERLRIFMEEHSSFKFIPIKEELSKEETKVSQVGINREVKQPRKYEENREANYENKYQEQQEKKHHVNQEEEYAKEPHENYVEKHKEKYGKNSEENLKKSPEGKHIKEFLVNHEEPKKSKKDESAEIEEIFKKAFLSPSDIVNTEPHNENYERHRKVTSNFWDDDMFDENNDNGIYEGSKEIINKIQDFSNSIDLNESKIKSESINKEESSTKIINKDNWQQGNTEQEKNVNDNENKAQESKALASDINNLRSKYLIGKITGEDLLDSNGNIVVSKNSLITNNIIEIAEKQGKLPELIVNMTLPEVSE